MGRLVYSTQVSLDGYITDAGGSFDFTEPDEEVHAFVNDSLRPIGTHLYGRRLYEVMVAWETMPTAGDQQPEMADYARIWQAADKVVYSSALTTVDSARTRIEKEFEPEAVRRLKESAQRDLSVGGPTLAAHAFAAGLVDEVHLFLCPVLVGGGVRALPDGVRLDLDLLDERRFSGGVVHLHHRVRGA